LPTEHGFWVMLLAAVLSAWLRTGFAALAIMSGIVVFGVAVGSASVLHRKIRGHESAQLVATACLALAGTPLEWAAGLPQSAVLSGTAARLAIFLASSLLVRSAFARSARKPRVSSRAWQLIALLLLATAFAILTLAGRHVEARACAMAGVACVALAWWSPTAKQLKPVGLALAGVAFGSAFALAL
jgi:hypothetical protein